MGWEGRGSVSPGNSNHHKDRRTREDRNGGGEGGGGGGGEGGGVRGAGERRGRKIRQEEIGSIKTGSGTHEPTHPQPDAATTAHDASEDKMTVVVELTEMTSLRGKSDISESFNSESSFRSVSSSSSPTPRENGVQEREEGGKGRGGGGGERGQGGGGEGGRRGRRGGRRGEGVGEEEKGRTVTNGERLNEEQAVGERLNEEQAVGERLNEEQAVGESKANERGETSNSMEEDISPHNTPPTMPSETPSHTFPPTTSSLSSSSTLTTTSMTQAPFAQNPADLPNAQSLNTMDTMDTSLLHDAMHDHSPQLQHTLLQAVNGIEHSATHRHREGAMGGRRGRSALSEKWGLDLDGLSRTCCEADQRLSDILGGYEVKIADLRHQLALAKAAAAAAVAWSSGNEGKGGREEEEEGGETGKEEMERNGVRNTEDDQVGV